LVKQLVEQSTMEQRSLKNVNNYLNTNIYSYLETSGGQSSNLYLTVAHFLTLGLIRHLWQLKTVVFLHWCLLCADSNITGSNVSANCCHQYMSAK